MLNFFFWFEGFRHIHVLSNTEFQCFVNPCVCLLGFDYILLAFILAPSSHSSKRPFLMSRHTFFLLRWLLRSLLQLQHSISDGSSKKKLLSIQEKFILCSMFLYVSRKKQSLKYKWLWQLEVGD